MRELLRAFANRTSSEFIRNSIFICVTASSTSYPENYWTDLDDFELNILTKVCKYKALATHYIGWMGSTDSLGTVEKRKYLAPVGNNIYIPTAVHIHYCRSNWQNTPEFPLGSSIPG
jgi:hypothetical protein